MSSHRAPLMLRWFRWSRLFVHLCVAGLLLSFLPSEGKRLARVKRWWSAGFVRLLGVRVSVIAKPPRSSSAKMGVMLASNHVSWLDIQVLDSILPARYIAKSEIRDWPGAGWIAAKAGTLFIRREKRSDTTRINSQITEALTSGDDVGLFPEGTTSEGDVLRRFHASLMEPAVACRAPIQPIAIRYRRADGSLCREAAFIGELSFVQSVALIIRQRGVSVEVSFADPIDTAGQHRKAVCDAAFRAVANQLGLSTEGNQPKSLSDLLAERQ